MMLPNMSGKIAVVTGGSSGIGAAIVNRFLEKGATVISLDLVKPSNQNQQAIHFDCDLTHEESVSLAFTDIKKNYGSVDIICANAGIVPAWSRITDTEFSDWKKVIDVNVNSLFLTISKGAELLKSGTGTVVITGSLNSWKGDANIASYVASKHAALGLLKSAALDLGREGIRVNGVAPGPIATQALISRVKSRIKKDDKDVESFIQKFAEATALKRIATIDEVVNTIDFLANEQSSGITGQLIAVDCGV
jgi:autotransporter-associated beta strand protein